MLKMWMHNAWKLSNPTNRPVFPWQTNVFSIEMEEYINNLTYIINISCQKVVFLIHSLEGHNLWQVTRRKTKLLTERFFPTFLIFYDVSLPAPEFWIWSSEKKEADCIFWWTEMEVSLQKYWTKHLYWYSAWEFTTSSTYECSAVELSGDNMQSAPTQILSWEIEPTCKCLGRQSCACSLLKNILLLKAVSTLCCCQIRPVYFSALI